MNCCVLGERIVTIVLQTTFAIRKERETMGRHALDFARFSAKTMKLNVLVQMILTLDVKLLQNAYLSKRSTIQEKNVTTRSVQLHVTLLKYFVQER